METKIRILAVIDTFSRFAHAIDARQQYRAENVAELLDGICRRSGYPKMIPVDKYEPIDPLPRQASGLLELHFGTEVRDSRERCVACGKKGSLECLHHGREYRNIQGRDDRSDCARASGYKRPGSTVGHIAEFADGILDSRFQFWSNDLRVLR